MGEAADIALVQTPKPEIANVNEETDNLTKSDPKSELKMRDLVDMMSKIKLNPMAKEFFPASYFHNQNKDLFLVPNITHANEQYACHGNFDNTRAFVGTVVLRDQLTALEAEKEKLVAENKAMTEEKTEMVKLAADYDKLVGDNLRLTEVEKLEVEKERMVEKYDLLEADNVLMAEDVEAEKSEVASLKAAQAEERTKFIMIANFSAFCAHVRALNFAKVPLSNRAWLELVYPCPQGAPPKPLDWTNIQDEELPRLPGHTTSTALTPHSGSATSTRRSATAATPPRILSEKKQF